MISESEYIKFAREAEHNLPSCMNCNPYIGNDSAPIRLAVEYEIAQYRMALKMAYHMGIKDAISILRFRLNQWINILHRKGIWQ